MAANKRTEMEVVRDRAEIARRHLAGQSQVEIARALGLSRQMVGYDLAALRREWLQSAQRDYHEKVAMEAARLNEVERTAWEALEKSKVTTRSWQRAVYHAANPTNPTMPPTPTLYGYEVIESAGNPQFLQVVIRCMELRMKLYGLDVRVNNQTGSSADTTADTQPFLTPQQRAARILELFRE